MTDAAASICGHAHRLLRGLPRHAFPFDIKVIPKDGLYVLFERGEEAHGGPRIVRVGTHTGAGQLRSRLHQHFLRENKDRSIFRKNVGRCLLARDGNPYLIVWECDLTTRAARAAPPAQYDTAIQGEIEGRVSEYIRTAFTFSVVEVSEKRDRLRFESGLVSLLSHCPECRPSAAWLGLHSPKNRIRESGLWQVNELYKTSITRDELSSLAPVPEP